jgi:hypothetical protein
MSDWLVWLRCSQHAPKALVKALHRASLVIGWHVAYVVLF